TSFRVVKDRGTPRSAHTRAFAPRWFRRESNSIRPLKRRLLCQLSYETMDWFSRYTDPSEASGEPRETVGSLREAAAASTQDTRGPGESRTHTIRLKRALHTTVLPTRTMDRSLPSFHTNTPH